MNQEVIDALCGMGYKQKEVIAGMELAKLSGKESLEDQILLTLQALSGEPVNPASANSGVDHTKPHKAKPNGSKKEIRGVGNEQAMAYPVMNVALRDISPDPTQPRTVFKQDLLEDLATSIAENGLLQPITVRPNPKSGSKYLLIAGERRWRAAALIGWMLIPAIVKEEISEGQAAKLQLLENIVRENLNPVEEAKALKKFSDNGYSFQEISRTVGIPIQHIKARIEMLTINEKALHLVSVGQLLPKIAYRMAKLSANNQMKFMRVYIHSNNMNPSDAMELCSAMLAEENQTEMFVETKVSKEQLVLARSFGDAMQKVGSLLCKLNQSESDNPGSLAEAMAVETNVAEQRIDAMRQELYRLKQALRIKRVTTYAKGQ